MDGIWSIRRLLHQRSLSVISWWWFPQPTDFKSTPKLTSSATSTTALADSVRTDVNVLISHTFRFVEEAVAVEEQDEVEEEQWDPAETT